MEFALKVDVAATKTDALMFNRMYEASKEPVLRGAGGMEARAVEMISFGGNGLLSGEIFAFNSRC